MQAVTVYVTAMQAIRRTADNCRRLLALLDAFGVAVTVFRVDSPETQAFVCELLEKHNSIACGKHVKGSCETEFELPLCFVGPVFVGTYDDMNELNEDGTLPKALRAAGYAGNFRASAHAAIPVDMAALATAAEAAAGSSGCKGGDGNTSGEDGGIETHDDDDDDDDDEPPPPPPTDDEDEDGSFPNSSMYGSSFNESDEPPLPPDDEEEEDDEPPPPPPVD